MLDGEEEIRVLNFQCDERNFTALRVLPKHYDSYLDCCCTDCASQSGVEQEGVELRFVLATQIYQATTYVMA